MNSDRVAEVRKWRDATLFKTYGDEGAAARLANVGDLNAVVEKILAGEPPAPEELEWADVSGEPLNPWHPWWGHQGPSSIEKRAKQEGLQWPPERDSNPYGRS